MRHLIDPLDFSQEEITSLLNLADRIRSDPAAYQDVAAHKKSLPLCSMSRLPALDSPLRRPC